MYCTAQKHLARRVRAENGETLLDASKEIYTYEKRPMKETYIFEKRIPKNDILTDSRRYDKRDLQKRSTKQTYKRDLQKKHSN